MNSQEFSYLDLSVLPETRALVLSPAAAILFDREFSGILWANSAGAALFGESGILEILSTRLSDGLPLIRQFQMVSSQMTDGKPAIRGFRIRQGDYSGLYRFKISNVELPHGGQGYLVENLDFEQSGDENDLAVLAIGALDGFADAAAIVDDFGLPLSNSESYADLGPDEESLIEMLEELKSEEDRMIKRPAVGMSGENVALGLARISDEPGRNLLVMQLSPSEQPNEEPHRSEQETKKVQPVPVDDEKIEPQHNDETPVESEIEERRFSSTEADFGDIADPEAGPVRFAWSIDADGVIQSVSPELGEVVGPNAADITGRKWQDVATVFGFDTTGDIGKLLAGRDTWSGKSVLWPVQGTDMVVPVDLAALPSFGNDRQFEGFKGFGIIRTADSILDPDETGLALSGVSATQRAAISEHTLEEDTVELVTEEPDSEEPITKEKEDDEEQEENAASGNVVSLLPETGTPTPLSDDESQAFRQIGEQLKRIDPGYSRNKALPDTSLIAALPVAVLIYRSDEVLFANQALLLSTGYETRKELEKAGGVAAILNTGSGEDVEPGRQYMTTKSGERVAINPVLHSVPWDEEKALLLSFVPAVEMDDHDLPSAVELSKLSEIQNILDTATDGVVLLGSDGDILSLNASAEALFGIQQSDAIDNPFGDLFAEESRATVDEYVKSQSSKGVERLLNDGREVIAAESNGGFIPVFLTISPLQSSEKLCAVVRDMTNWKKVEEELSSARRQAEIASEQKTDFLAHVSHEIRVPLNSIIGFSDVMLEERFGPVANERYLDYLRDIKRSGLHVLELVNDLLDLSKIEAGKLELAFEAVDLNQIVSESVALVQPQANENRIIIRTSLSLAVPKVVADPRSIRQIILNLVSNAIKYSEPNSQVIVSTVYESTGEVALRIRDTGHGMTDRQIEEAMKPFQQVHSIGDRTDGGTGLGLPLTKALVEANRAHFDLESEPDHGTIAHVHFPSQRVLAD